MLCPACGHLIADGKSRCLRCGYMFKSIAVRESDNDDNEDVRQNQESEEFIEIDPDDVRLHGNNRSGSFGGGGSILDELFGGSIFGGSGSIFGGGGGGGLFGGFSSIIDDIFGGIFGTTVQDEDDDYDGENHYVDEFGRPMPIDVFGRDFVEVEDVECYDENGNLKENCKKKKKDKKDKRKDKGSP